MFCTKCGAKLMPGDLFCIPCGAPVPEMNAINYTGQETLEQIISHIDNADESLQVDNAEGKDRSIPYDDNNTSKEDDEADSALQKPLYGYEPYHPSKVNKEAVEAPVQTQNYSAVSPGVINTYEEQPVVRPVYYQNPASYNYAYQRPLANHTVPYSERNQPYYNSPYNTGYAGSTKKTQSVRIGPILFTFILVFVIGFLCQGIILNQMKRDIRETIKKEISDLYSGANNYYSESPDYNSADDAWQEENSTDYSSYEGLIENYFKIVGNGKADAIKELLHPKVITALDLEGYTSANYADAIDSFREYYGSKVEDYTVYGSYPYYNSDYLNLCEKLGFEKAEIEQYLSVSVGAEITKNAVLESVFYDFDLIKVEGEWYLVSIW